MISHSTLARWLRPMTLAYLSIPLGIFLLKFVRWEFSLPLVALLVFSLYQELRRGLRDFPAAPPAENEAGMSLRSLALCLLPCLFLLCHSGIGGWGYQERFDWIKHEAIVHDLIESTGPVSYSTEQGPVLLVYYVAYYLPAVVVGKLFGWQAATQALFLTTLIGTYLAALWTCALTRSRPWVAGMVFATFSGMDVFGYLATGFRPGWHHLEWWSRFAQYSSVPALLFYVPNQAIAGWLLVSLLWQDTQVKQPPRAAGLYMAIAALWSPFVAIGLAPFLLWEWLRVLLHPRQWLTTTNCVGGLLIMIFLLYYMARGEAHPTFASEKLLEIGRFKLQSGKHFVLLLVAFLLLEFAILHSLVYTGWFALKRGAVRLPLLPLATLTLLVYPFLHYGHYNDLVMRASIPGIMITMLATLTVLSAQQWLHWQRVLQVSIAVVLVLGSVTSLVEVRRHVEGLVQQSLAQKLDADGNPKEKTRYEALFDDLGEEPDFTLADLKDRPIFQRLAFFDQYIGSTNSRFVRYLARPLQAEASVRRLREEFPPTRFKRAALRHCRPGLFCVRWHVIYADSDQWLTSQSAGRRFY